MPTPLFITPAGGIPVEPLPPTLNVPAPQPQPATISVPPVASMVQQEPQSKTSSSEMFLGESGATRSGLLVVLDDDQEMPPQLASERIAKGDSGTSSASRMSPIKIESFLDEMKDDTGGGDLKLPELPPLPPKQG